MKDLYKGFKKVSEDQNKAVLKHDNGHTLHIAKKGLGSKLLQSLSKLPLHQAEPKDVIPDPEKEQADVSAFEDVLKETEGGEQYTKIPTEELLQREPQLSPARRQAPIDYIRGALSDVLAPPNVRTGLSDVKAEQARYEQEHPAVQEPARQPSLADETTQQPAQDLTEKEQPKEPSLAAAPSAPVAAAAPMTMEQKQERALESLKPMAQRTPEQILNDPKAPVAERQMAAQNLVDAELADLQNKEEQFQKEARENAKHVPKLFENKNTFQRIMTAVGLIVSGAGAGVTGGDNVFLKSLQDDIATEALNQKNDETRRFNLYKMHREHSLDKVEALLKTQNNLRSIAITAMDEKLGMLSLNPTANPMAIERIKNAKMRLMLENEQAMMSIQTAKLDHYLKMQAYADMLGGEQGKPGELSKQDPASLIRFRVPEGDRKEVAKEVAQAQAAKNAEEPLLEWFDKAVKENTVLARAGRLGFVPPSIKAMAASELPVIRDLEGRVNEYEQQTLHDLHPKPGDLDKTIADKRKAYSDFLRNKKTAPLAKTYGIDLSKFESTAAGKRKPLPKYEEGTKAKDPKTGKIVIFKNGQWQPYGR